MARKQRICFPYAMYHITTRGVRKMSLFYEEADYLKYLQLLEDTRKDYPFLLHSYCIMTNHVHLQLQTINDPIPKIMKKLNENYATYFNKKYEFTGHVFQGRYGAELITTADYERDVSKYIHLNPVHAQMVKKPEDYRWSSYRAYIFNEKNRHVFTEKLLSYFPHPTSDHYQKFVNQIDLSPEPPPKIQPFVSQT